MACWNAVTAAYRIEGDSWITGLRDGTYIEIKHARMGQSQSESLTTADTLNDWIYRGQVLFMADAYRTWATGRGWSEWKSHAAYSPFIICTYARKNNIVTLSASDQLSRQSTEDLTPPANIPAR